MRAVIEIDGKLNSGVNGCLLKNCSISSGETAASENYIQNFRKNKKIEVKDIDGKIIDFEELGILASFASRRDGSVFILTEGEGEGMFRIMRKLPGNSILFNPFRDGKEFAKKQEKLGFSYDFAKINEFAGFDCVLVCAFGALVAFSEEDFDYREINTGIAVLPKGSISGIAAFANRMVATFEGSDEYFWSGIARADFVFLDNELPTGANFAASEYSNDMTVAVRRTGTRLAVFTRTSIEIKDLSQDPQLPFQGHLYQNNYDIGAIADTIRSIGGALYFVGQEGSGGRFIYSLADGAPRKLTNENQCGLLSGKFESSGAMMENGNVFYLAYGTRSFGIDTRNRSLFELDRKAGGRQMEFIDYLQSGSGMLRVCKSGFYAAEPGSDDYVAGSVRLPRHDFGAAASISKISFIGEFLESRPATASLTAERGFYQQAKAHRRGFDFFMLGLQKLNDLEFSVNENFRLTKIEINYQLLKNGSFYGAG